MFKGVQYTLHILRLLCHIQLCSDAIVWRLKLHHRFALIPLLSTLSKSVFLNIFVFFNPGKSHILSISGETCATSPHGPPVLLLVNLSKSVSSWAKVCKYLQIFGFGLSLKVSNPPFPMVCCVLWLQFLLSLVNLGKSCQCQPIYHFRVQYTQSNPINTTYTNSQSVVQSEISKPSYVYCCVNCI